jgi:enoyl-CoA hydratase
MSPHATRVDEDGVVYLTFTRPEKRNAVSREMFEMIRVAVEDLRDQDHLRVLVITGEGEYFTGGKDVADLRVNVGEGTDGTVRGSNMRAQSCDFRLAAEGSMFGLPEVQNLAVLPGSGGISRLTRLVGPHWARWLAMACEPVDAQQALAIGFVHAVYPKDDFADRVRAFAQKLVAMPREALGVTKVAIDMADTVDRGTSRVFDRFAQTLLFSADEFKDRVNAFNQASAARQKGRN